MPFLLNRRLSFRLGLLLLAWLWTYPVHADNLSSIPPNLLQASKLHSIDIEDNWMGLSQLGPLGKHYVLKPEGNAFVGKATFSAGGGSNVKTKEETLSIPQEAVQGFLQSLASSPLVKGPYEAKIDHTDDYPSQKIEVVLDSETLTFLSQSQGAFAIPWALKFRGEGYVISSKDPAEALKKLKPYLKEDSYQKFLEEQQAAAQNRHR